MDGQGGKNGRGAGRAGAEGPTKRSGARRSQGAGSARADGRKGIGSGKGPEATLRTVS